MGIMSKGNQRLAERPLPPNVAERDDDIKSTDDTDIVFSIGQKYLTDYYQASPSTTPTMESPVSNTSTTSNTSTSNSSNITSLNASTESEISQEQVKEAFDDVIRLMSMYSDLKNVPSELEGKYSTLKSTSEELSGSISKLRALSLNFGVMGGSGIEKHGEMDSKIIDGKRGGSKSKTRRKQ